MQQSVVVRRLIVRMMVVVLLLLLCQGAAFVVKEQRGACRSRRRPPTCLQNKQVDDEAAEASSLAAAVGRARQVSDDRVQDERRQDKLRAAENARPVSLMRDKRVQLAQEPAAELKELMESGSWGLMGAGQFGSRLAIVCFIVTAAAYGLVDNYDTYNELVELDLPSRLALSLPFGGFSAFFVAVRAALRTGHVAGRLSEDKLYFEESGWGDGFTMRKPADSAYRDRLLLKEQLQPKIQPVRNVAAGTALGFALVLIFSLLTLR